MQLSAIVSEVSTSVLPSFLPSSFKYTSKDNLHELLCSQLLPPLNAKEKKKGCCVSCPLTVS